MKTMAAAATRADERLRFPDGLRGVAALMVVVYHLHDAVLPAVRDWLPSWVSSVLGRGNLGVEVFFVLSGFVIAHSTRDAERSWRFLARFGLRRSIRLDPPMWATVFLEIAVIGLTMRLFPDKGASLPTIGEVLANMTYMQGFLGITNVVPVLWSLTYEVQFYVVLVTGLILFGSAGGRRRRSGWALFILSIIYSFVIWMTVAPVPVRGLFIERWYQFAFGILAWLVFSGRLSARAVIVVLFGALAISAVLAPTEYRFSTTATSVLTAGALIAAGYGRGMTTWLSGAVLQFLGRISYSLYLVHGTIGWRFVALIGDLAGGALGPLAAIAVFFSGVGVSIAAAWFMYRLLEVPSVAFAKRITLPRAAASTA